MTFTDPDGIFSVLKLIGNRTLFGYIDAGALWRRVDTLHQYVPTIQLLGTTLLPPPRHAFMVFIVVLLLLPLQQLHPCWIVVGVLFLSAWERFCCDTSVAPQSVVLNRRYSLPNCCCSCVVWAFNIELMRGKEILEVGIYLLVSRQYIGSLLVYLPVTIDIALPLVFCQPIVGSMPLLHLGPRYR